MLLEWYSEGGREGASIPGTDFYIGRGDSKSRQSALRAEKELAKTIHGRRGEGKAGLNSDRMAALSWYQAGGLECLLACRLNAKGDIAAAKYRQFLVVIASQHAKS